MRAYERIRTMHTQEQHSRQRWRALLARTPDRLDGDFIPIYAESAMRTRSVHQHAPDMILQALLVVIAATHANARATKEHRRRMSIDGQVDDESLHSLLSDPSLVMFSSAVEKLTDAVGACERIHRTPMPFPYSLLLHRTAIMYVALMPWALIGIHGWVSVIITGIVAYAFFGLDEMASIMENPFSCDEHALALQTMCRTIDSSLAEALLLPVPPVIAPYSENEWEALTSENLLPASDKKSGILW